MHLHPTTIRLGLPRPALAALALLVGAVALGLVGPASATGAPASNERSGAAATFGLGPSSGSGPDGRSAFAFGVTPGAHLTDRLALVNLADQPVTVAVYPVDAVPDDQGGAQLPPAAAKPVAAGSWFHLSLDTGSNVSVNARSTVVLPFTVEVPAGAAAGDHQAALIASLSTYARNAQGTRVRVDQRLAVRAYLRVAGTLVPRLGVTGLHASYRSGPDPLHGTVDISYVVRNTGNVRLGATQQVVVRGLLGSTARAPGLSTLPPLPPGASKRVAARVAVVAEVHSRVEVRLTPVAAPGDVDGALMPITRQQGLWTIPWLLLAIVAVLAGLVVAVYVVRRRHRRGPQVPPDPTPPEQPSPNRERVPA